MKNKFWYYPIILLFGTVTLATSCKKDDNTKEKPGTGVAPIVFNPDKTYGTMTDKEGNVYKTITISTKKSEIVTIGTKKYKTIAIVEQTWMAENLRVTQYRNGDPLQEDIDNTAWLNSSAGAYCNYNNTSNSDSIATFGRLYNWYAVNDSRNIAPIGWHIPSNAEWKILTDNLGGEKDCVPALKETGSTHWTADNSASTNSSGFTALPAGNCGSQFSWIGGLGGWWSSTETVNECAWQRSIWDKLNSIDWGAYDKHMKCSVRCVKDN
jgi:uncharacterized protein (TIGR02145 family)